MSHVEAAPCVVGSPRLGDKQIRSTRATVIRFGSMPTVGFTFVAAGQR
jgi:hypothetical protein